MSNFTIAALLSPEVQSLFAIELPPLVSKQTRANYDKAKGLVSNPKEIGLFERTAPDQNQSKIGVSSRDESNVLYQVKESFAAVASSIYGNPLSLNWRQYLPMLGHEKSPTAQSGVYESKLVTRSIVATESPTAGNSVIGEILTSVRESW